MMDCKKALSSPEVNGDMTKAMDWLRAKGIARASSSAERVASEGVIACLVNDELTTTTLVEVNSETDFVSRNKDFQSFVALVASTASATKVIGTVDIATLLSNKPTGTAHATLQDSLGELISSIRENIVIRRVVNIEGSSSEKSLLKHNRIVAAYVHGKVGQDTLPPSIQMGTKTAVLSCSLKPSVENNSATSGLVVEMCRKLAMHVVAANPKYLNTVEVPKDVIENETKIFREQTEESNSNSKKVMKPDILEKVVQGKVNKRLAELCLLEQNHVAEENSPVVKSYIKDFSSKNKIDNLSIDSFLKWSLGGDV